MRIGCVITAAPGREENLTRTLAHVLACAPGPLHTVVILDGVSSARRWTEGIITYQEAAKHQPGMEQPRNVGVRVLREVCPDATHVWFLDSDLIFKPDILQAYHDAYAADPVREIIAPERHERSSPGPMSRIMIGPYDWLPHGSVEMPTNLRQDIRWASFDEHGPETVLVNDLGTALGNFGGNLLWPIDKFEWVGGFWNELHHGRCEDGELGLRAAAAGVPMSLVRGARAWHVSHAVNMEWCMHANARDVPMLDARHPWVQGQGIIVTESDGARFDFNCPDCDLIMNSHDSWGHTAWHRAGSPGDPIFLDPASVRRG